MVSWQQSLRRISLALLAFALMAQAACRSQASDLEIGHDLKFIAAFSSDSLIASESEMRFLQTFQSRYRSRIVLFRPVTGQAYLPQLKNKASLFALIRISTDREARIIAREIERSLPQGALLSLYPVAQMTQAQDNMAGQIFYLSFEKRKDSFNHLTGAQKTELAKKESDEILRDRNLLSYFAAFVLSDTPYQTLHLMGYSGIAETQYQTLDGQFYRALKKYEAADTVLVEKIR